MLCCVLKGLGASRGSMVASEDSRITDHINQSQCSSHHKEEMAQYLWNLEVFLVLVLDVDGLDTASPNVEWTQMLLATSVEKLGISKQPVAWEYQRVVQYNGEDLHALLEEQCLSTWDNQVKVLSKGIYSGIWSHFVKRLQSWRRMQKTYLDEVGIVHCLGGFEFVKWYF